MSYTFTIGNAVPQFIEDEDGRRDFMEVEDVTSEEAPVFPNDSMTGNSNSRSPSYTGWRMFCDLAGLYGLFYDENGRIRGGHPGCVPITTNHLEVVRSALRTWEKRAELPPGFEGNPVKNRETGEYEIPDEGRYDPILARLIWLDWWLNWAVANCENPSIQNT